ncbi:MAG: ATP-grasp domain-containing protein [Chitinophagaceae bacterium]|nr:MAG: ATP-grasp domain-containing protein [Chitinophagaceae bacterium]
MKPSIHVLMTGAGAPGAAGIIQCLLQDPVIQLSVADADEGAVGRHLHDRFYLLPKGDAENFAAEVLALCKRENIDIVLPLVTKELFPLSRYKEEFNKAGVQVLVSSHSAIQTANDKGACYRFLSEKGIPVPQFHLVHTTEEFIHAAFELGHPQQSFCFKPTVANGSRGFRIVSDSINEAEHLFHQKPYNTFITYTHALKILSSQPFPPLVVTEYLPGDEYSVDCLADKGKALLVVPRLRQKMINGISVQGRFEKDEAIIAYCTQIIEAIGLHGNIGIQVKRNAYGQPLLLEINPRVQGTIVAGLGAGVNLPVLALRNAMGLPLAEEAMQVRWGTSFMRYWTEVFY